MPEKLAPWAGELSSDLKGLPKALSGVRSKAAQRALTALMRTAPRRTGKLRRSLSVVASERGITIGSDADGADLQDTGGTVRTRGKLLKVPINGVAGSTLDRSLFALRARDGRIFLAGKIAGEIVLRYRLMQSVKIKGTGYATRGLESLRSDCMANSDKEVMGALL